MSSLLSPLDLARYRCVSRARAKAEAGRPLCVGTSYRGNAYLCFYHCDMRNLALIICNVVATPDYSRPRCNVNLYNFNMTISKAGCTEYTELLNNN
jgi:hypothetical protein